MSSEVYQQRQGCKYKIAEGWNTNRFIVGIGLLVLVS